MSTTRTSPLASSHRRDEHGFVAVWFALTLVLLLIIGAFVIDLSHVSWQSSRAQKAADAAAHAGVIYLPGRDDLAKAVARQVAIENLGTGWDNYTITPEVENTTRLQVTITSNIDTLIAQAVPGLRTLFQISKLAEAGFYNEAQMGSPSNVFGNESTWQGGGAWRAEGGSQPGMWASVNGPMSQNAAGDKTHDYQYLIDVKAGGTLDLQIFDPIFTVQSNSRPAVIGGPLPEPCTGGGMVHWGSLAIPDPYKTGVGQPYCTGDEDLDGSVPWLYTGGSGTALPPCPTCTADDPRQPPRVAAPEAFGTGAKAEPASFMANRFGGYKLYPRTYFTLYQSDNNDANLSDNPVVCSSRTWDPDPGDGSPEVGNDVKYMAYTVFFNSWMFDATSQFYWDLDSGVIGNGPYHDDVKTHGGTGAYWPDGYALSDGALLVANTPFANAAKNLLYWGYGSKSAALRTAIDTNKTLFNQAYRKWVDYCSASVSAGHFVLRVNTTNTAMGSGTNHYALRAKLGSSDYTDVSISGNGSQSIYGNLSGGASLYLAKVYPSGNARRLKIGLYDLGDATDSNGNTVSGTMALLHDNGTTEFTTCVWNIDGGASTTGPCSGIPVNNGLNGKTLNIQVEIPADYACTNGLNPAFLRCWMRAKFTWPGGSIVRDVTSWNAKVDGDPIRLTK